LNKKLIGVLTCLLLIATVFPVTGIIIDKNHHESSTRLCTKYEKSSLSPGDYFRFIIVDERLRSYRFHIPLGYNNETAIPIVFSLHGHGANAWDMRRYTEFDDKSDEEGFVVVYPNGHFIYKGIIELLLGLWYGWNFWENQNYDADDVGYIRTLIEYFQEILNINASRMYITGGSGGACMAYRLGAELSDEIAAIAPLAGSIGGAWGYTPHYMIPTPSNPLPVVVFHGMQDLHVPYFGGWADGVDWMSVDESISFWVVHNMCNPIPEIETSESGNIITKTYTGGSNGSEVVLYTVVNGGHEWFGSPYFPPCEISATDLIWDFFEQHPKQ